VEILDLSPRPSDGPVAVPLGGSIPFTAAALAADETPVPEAPLTWSLPDTAVAAFDAASRSLTGKSLGETELKVRAPGEGLEATWQITVIEGGLALDSEELTLTRGEERPIIASFTDQSGAPVSEASGVTWTSSDPGVLEVDDEGLLSAIGFGTARVLVSTPWGSADSAIVYVQGEVLVTYDSGGSADLYTLDRDQPGELHQVTTEPGSEVDGQFSPDGTRLVYVTDQGGNRDIVAANADGSSPTRLTSTVYEEHSPDEWWSGHPVVSPNGSTIAYVVARDDETDIYLMNLDGTNQRNFTASEINEALPAWVGDSALAYLTEERRNRVMTRTVTRMNFMREVTNLSPEGLPVTDFAISRDGETLGVIVSAQGPQGQESRLYFIPLVGDATPGEVPRASQGDQMLSPSFRR
jgi:hypothetical protein